MTKQEQFLWVVQTLVLVNAGDIGRRFRASHLENTAEGVSLILSEAIFASERIPDDLSAADAAMQFCENMFSNLRVARAKVLGREPAVPHWFVRPR
jgi:hypothetical protein